MGEVECDAAGQGSMSELWRLKRGGPFCSGMRKAYFPLLWIVVDNTVSNVPGSIDYDSKDFVLEDSCFFTVGKNAPNLRCIREDRSQNLFEK
ncbi:hypothetical protein AVEN_205607-1 [Araneus ventricosus]|uniref:Uncharacterized protein n=1 Tax=Araneus ventricosus TaxID=182803 RepID=A0A4Y2X6P2_ARAVE|nr:hypothetical protein AVEN_205607-1 [Araneus ventricosus]